MGIEHLIKELFRFLYRMSMFWILFKAIVSAEPDLYAARLIVTHIVAHIIKTIYDSVYVNGTSVIVAEKGTEYVITNRCIGFKGILMLLSMILSGSAPRSKNILYYVFLMFAANISRVVLEIVTDSEYIEYAWMAAPVVMYAFYTIETGWISWQNKKMMGREL